MGRWLPAILLFGLTTLCSCAEEPDNAYPGNTQNKALKAWMTQNRPDLLENYQEEGEYYVDVVSLGDLADSRFPPVNTVFTRYSALSYSFFST